MNISKQLALSILTAIAMVPSVSHSKPDFIADFNRPKNLAATLNGKQCPPIYANRHQRHQTAQDTGITGSAALFCRDNLQDFQHVVPNLMSPLGTIIYDDLATLHTDQGNVELHIKPFFNDKTPKDKIPHNYVFCLYQGKNRAKALTLFIVNHRQITVQFEFSNGKHAYLYAFPENWRPGQWKKLNIRWKNALQQLYVDGTIAEELCVEGTLKPFDRLELGGIDGGYHLLQGLIDDLTIGRETPPGLKIVNLRQERELLQRNEGDPKRFGIVASSQLMLKHTSWSHAEGIQPHPSQNGLRLTWQGGDFRHRTVYGPPINVTPKTVLRGDLTFRKERWDYAVYAPAGVAFFDVNGRPLTQDTGYDGTHELAMRFDQTNIRGYSPMALVEFTEQTGLGTTIHYFNYWKVPDQAHTMCPAWTFAYNPCSVEVTQLQFRTVDPALKTWKTQPKDVKRKQNVSSGITDQQLNAILKRRQRATAIIRKEGDRVELYVNGTRTLPAFMHNTPYPVKNIPFYSHTFAQLGMKISTVWCTLGKTPVKAHLPAAVREDGTLDLAPWQQAVREIVRQAPDGYVILALNVSPTNTWLNEHQDQLMKNARGENFIYGYPHYPIGKGAANALPPGPFSWSPSLFSRTYRTYISDLLARTLRAFEKTPESKAVIGLYLVGGDDAQFRLPNIAFTPDLSPCARQAFKDYLKQKYGSTQQLRKAWNNPNVSLETVKIPTRQELWVPDRPYYHAGHPTWQADYKSAYALSERTFKIAIRKAAKSSVPRLLVGGYDCTYGISGSWGHTGYHFGQSIDDAADFYIWIPSYGRARDLGELSLGPYQFTGSLALHGKLGILEMDVRNPSVPSLFFGHYRSRNWQQRHDQKTYAIALKRLAATAISLGGGFHCYNLQPHWVLTEEAQQAWKQAKDIAEQRQGEPFTRDQMAIFIDENTNFHANLHPRWIPSYFNYKGAVIAAAQRAGIRHNYYLLQDALNPDFNPPAMLVFADAGTLPLTHIAEIRRKYGKDGRIIVWHGCPGFLNSDNYNQLSQHLNFNIKPRPARHPSPLVVTNHQDPIMQGMDGFFMQEPNFLPFVFSPAWEVKDTEATQLATFHGTSLTGMAVKRHQTYTEVFIGQPGAISPRLLRNLAREAGVKPLLQTDDLLMVGGGLMTVCASLGDGIRTIALPEGVQDVKSLTGHDVIRRHPNRTFDVFIPHGEAAVFKLIRTP